MPRRNERAYREQQRMRMRLAREAVSSDEEEQPRPCRRNMNRQAQSELVQEPAQPVLDEESAQTRRHPTRNRQPPVRFTPWSGSYYHENTGSRSMPEVKRGQDLRVLG